VPGESDHARRREGDCLQEIFPRSRFSSLLPKEFYKRIGLGDGSLPCFPKVVDLLVDQKIKFPFFLQAACGGLRFLTESAEQIDPAWTFDG